MRALISAATATLWLLSLSGTGNSLTAEEIIEDFRKVVLGAEASSLPRNSAIVRKFAGPVRFYLHNRSSLDRQAEAERFILALPTIIRGLDVQIVEDRDRANFHLYIADRQDYRGLVEAEIYKRKLDRAPGRCFVAAVAKSGRIQRSTAIIISDEGESVFKRCLIEEVLQGLGPLNDASSAEDSLFNDRSTIDRLTEHDRLLLNILYDPRLKPGMRWRQARRVLPDVVAEAMARLSGPIGATD